MAKFVILFEKSKRDAPREALLRHIDHLRNLRKKNILFLCGPFTNHNGAMQILDAKNYEDAEGYAQSDPFTTEGYFSKYTIYEWIDSNEGNNYLLTD
jgi:uncharacterized protein YciI